MPDKKRRQNGGRWAWRLGRLDIRVKSPQAQANCARSQISGAVTQIVVSSLTAASVLQSFDPVPLALWVLAIWTTSAYRIISARWLLRHAGDKVAVGRWQRGNLLNFLLIGIIWASLAWLPQTEMSLLVITAVLLVPTGIAAAASHNLGAMPLGMFAMVYPIGINHALTAMRLFEGFGSFALAFSALLYIPVMTIGALMVNRSLLSEWRLARINRGIAHRSSSQAAALAATQRELLAANRRLQLLAGQDVLTELANRRTFQARLKEQEALRQRHGGGTISLILIDLDHFKQINDQFGHPVGDMVLAAFGQLLKGRLRAADLAARIGGEEFALLLPETDEVAAERLANLIRQAMADMDIQTEEGIALTITGSFGIACWGADETASQLMQRADRALYVAKQSGRDTIRQADAPPLQ